MAAKLGYEAIKYVLKKVLTKKGIKGIATIPGKAYDMRMGQLADEMALKMKALGYDINKVTQKEVQGLLDSAEAMEKQRRKDPFKGLKAEVSERTGKVYDPKTNTYVTPGKDPFKGFNPKVVKTTKKDRPSIRLIKNFERDLTDIELAKEGYNLQEIGILKRARQVMKDEGQNPDDALSWVRSEMADDAGIEFDEFMTDFDWGDFPGKAEGGRIGFGPGGLAKGAKWFINSLKKNLTDMEAGHPRFKVVPAKDQETLKVGYRTFIKELEAGEEVPIEALEAISKNPQYFKTKKVTRSQDPDLAEVEELIDAKVFGNVRQELKDFEVVGRKSNAAGGRVPLMYGGDPGFAFEYGGSWADWHDQHRDTMPVEQYIQTKLPKERLPFREMQSGGLAYMLGEPTYMKYGAGGDVGQVRNPFFPVEAEKGKPHSTYEGQEANLKRRIKKIMAQQEKEEVRNLFKRSIGGSVGHAPWLKPSGQQQPQGQEESPTPQVGGAQTPGRGQPNPMKAPRGLPSLAPRTMDPQYMQQQAMQRMMMGQGQPGQQPRMRAAEGGRQYPGPHLPDRAFYEPHRQKTRKPYKSIKDVPPEILVMLMKDPNFDPNMFMDIEWSEPEGTWYKGGHRLRGVYYGHEDPNVNLAGVEMGDKPARHPEAEPEDFVRKIHLNLNPFSSDDRPSPRARDWTSNMDKARIASHEMRHKAYLEDRDLWESQPEWVKKVKGTGYLPKGGTQGHELFNRFMDQRYYPQERLGKDHYFDKILKDLWEPSAKEYERITAEKDLGEKYAQGGRIGFGLGGINKGRRAFMKWLAGILGTGVAAGTGLLKYGSKAAPKVIKEAEVITRGADGMPKYIYDLIEVVKAKGVRDVIEGFKRSDYSTVHSYKGVEVIEEAGGTTRIKKPTEGVATDSTTGKMHEGTSKEIEMEISPQYREEIDPDSGVSWYTNEKGKKVYETKIPDEYAEGTVYPDMDGKMKDFQEGIDDLDHLELKKIADEAKDLLKTKKASGGVAHLLGE